jgi:hypothetical protein
MLVPHDNFVLRLLSLFPKHHLKTVLSIVSEELGSFRCLLEICVIIHSHPIFLPLFFSASHYTYFQYINIFALSLDNLVHQTFYYVLL